MKSILTSFALMIVLFPCHRMTAQKAEEIHMIEYFSGYIFEDGIYHHIDAVKVNDPIPFNRIVSDRNVYDKAFIKDLIIKKEIVLYDEAGVRASISTADIWGYALHGRLYIMLGGKFHRLMLQGGISQFIASATTNERVYYADEDSSTSHTTTQDLYQGFYREPYYYRRLTAEGEICLYDFESNTLEQYEPSALGKLLERDSVLFSEFATLRKREKKKRMAEFIRRYNQRNPLYFPAE
jgi:hypothetical protein